MNVTVKSFQYSGFLFDFLAQKDNTRSIFLFVFLFIMLLVFPLYWLDNEINYFDLGRRLISPDAFSEHSAVFDHSVARSLGLGLIGALVELLGTDIAFVVSRIAVAICLAIALTALATAWSLSAAELLLALAAFMLLGQSYFAGEWIIKGVEAKVFAYIVVILSVALASRDKPGWAILLSVLATYFHFLVGGFWTLAVLLLIALQDKSLNRVARLTLFYAVSISPLLAILIYERLLVPTPDMSRYGLSLNEIYAVFRAPHHVAPYNSPGDFADWVPGIFGLLAMLLSLSFLVGTQRAELRSRFIWLTCLNGYLVLALLLALLDRHNHFLAPLYIFRPNSLILLLSLIVLASWFSRSIDHRAKHGVAVFAVALIVTYVGPQTAISTYQLLHSPGVPIEATFDNEDAPEMLDWIGKNTDKESVVVIQYVKANTIFDLWRVNFERLIGRPTLVNWKFVPTAKADLARWYGLIEWQDAVFRGDCSRISEQPVDFLVTVEPQSRRLVENCGTLLWTQGDYGVVGNLR